MHLDKQWCGLKMSACANVSEAVGPHQNLSPGNLFSNVRFAEWKNQLPDGILLKMQTVVTSLELILHIQCTVYIPI